MTNSRTRSRSGRSLTCIALCCLLLLCGSCAAQQGGADLADLSLEDLAKVQVYSASMHMQSTEDAPSSVTLVTAAEIHEHGYRTLAAILETLRGFFITYDRNYTSLGVRGFSRPGDYNSRVLLLIDGHRLNDNIYDQAMIGTEFPIDVDLIERIEVVRGPVSALYGSNALFAVINVVTKTGKEVRGLELASDVASFRTEAGRISYGRRSGQLDMLLSGSFYGSGGHRYLYYPEFDSPATNNGVSVNCDDDQLGSALASVDYRELSFRSAFGTREKGIPTGSYGTVFNDPGTRTEDSHGYADLRWDHKLPDSWALMTRAFYDRYSYQGTYENPSSVDPTQISPNMDYGDGKWWGAEVQGTKSGSRNRLVFGAELRDNFRQNQSNYNLNPYQPILDDRRSSYITGLYVQDELALNKVLTLSGGLRFDYDTITPANLDPRIALVYRPRAGTTLKLTYGEAFRAPNLYELYYAVPPNIADPTLRPEKINTVEAVWEEQVAKHLSWSVSAFQSRISNLISQVGTDSMALVFENLGGVRSTSVEVEFKGDVPRGPEWTASYTSTDTEDTVTGQFLNNSPRTLAKVNLSEPLWQRRLVTSVDAQYRSRIETVEGNEISPFYLINATVLGRKLGQHAELSASVYNLLNKVYSDPPTGADVQAQIPQDGRNFRLQLTWRVGER